MKSLKILLKDGKIATRDMLLIYILVIPILFAVIIRVCSPGISDSAVKIAMLKEENQDLIAYMEDIAQVELFDSREDLEKRVLKRDDVPGLISNGANFDVVTFDIVTEGNEDYEIIDTAKTIAALYGVGSVKEDTTATISSLGKTVPRVRTMLTGILIELIIMLSGMIIAVGTVDEKASNTISAVRVSPVSFLGFVCGKCLFGVVTGLVSILLCLVILGYTHVNLGMILLISISIMVLSGAAGLLQGVISTDVIEAAAGMKLMLIPMAAAALIYQLCSEKWQWTMYWNPFYWAFKATDLVLSDTAVWSEVMLWSALILVISILFCVALRKKIDRGLKKV